jgi:hypothetical protein
MNRLRPVPARLYITCCYCTHDDFHFDHQSIVLLQLIFISSSTVVIIYLYQINLPHYSNSVVFISNTSTEITNW